MNFTTYMNETSSAKLEYFFKNLSPTNRTPEYYVNWDKVIENTKEIELSLNTLNYLIGKEDIRNEANQLFISQPNLLKAVPALIASRDSNLDVLSFDNENNMYFENVNFKKIDSTKLDDYLDFMDKSGLLKFLQNNVQRNLVDYVFGVEAGLDSNARKNRSGTTMENIVERIVAKTCETLNLDFRIQVTSNWMEKNWGVHVPVDKSARRFDVAVYDKEKHKVYVIETNYYGGNGSKLKSVCGEFTTLNQLVNTSNNDVVFIWITDGLGWESTKIPMSEAFAVIDNVFNLSMLKNNFLTELFSN